MSDSSPASGRPAERPAPTEALPAADGERAAVRDPNAPPRTAQPGQSGQRRRRGSRGGRGRGRSGSGGGGGNANAPAENGAAQAQPAPAPAKPKIGDTRPAPVPAATRPVPTDGDDEGGGGPGRKRRRRGGRGRSGGGGGGGAGTQPVEAVRDRPVELDEEVLERRRGRERKGRPVGRYLMVVHVRPGATQIAVLEGRALIEHYVSKPADDATQIDGNIYQGRVQNVLPGMEAAFIDIGTPKNAVLYRGDVRYDTDDLVEGSSGPDKNARIEQLLKPGQTILCQWDPLESTCRHASLSIL